MAPSCKSPNVTTQDSSLTLLNILRHLRTKHVRHAVLLTDLDIRDTTAMDEQCFPIEIRSNDWQEQGLRYATRGVGGQIAPDSSHIIGRHIGIFEIVLARLDSVL